MNEVADYAISLLAVLLAFAVGFAIRRGSICAVDASKQWIVERKTLRIRAFVVAAASSGLAIIPLSWIFPGKSVLASTYPVTVTVLLAGAAFGIGARINGGCAFGTLAKLSGGNLSFLGTIIGSIVGVMGTMMMVSPQDALPSPFIGSRHAAMIAFGLCLVLALPALKRRHLQNLGSIFTRRDALLRPFTAMLIIGVLGGLLFALAGNWTYLAVIGDEGVHLTSGADRRSTLKAIIGASAMVAGALFAAIRSGRFQLTKGPPMKFIRCVIGGAIMGSAASVIPGGNGALLVYSLPSGAYHAWAAYAAMSIILAISFMPMRKERLASAV
ncbi:YeeE/YedE thiosulfate transporter family protein [Altererythrobacter sp. ZODW24]|uniref:YeeE/YedE thiosulfate transporter family protein n=1 Tax=Altererythrobacter sp. ZODW24 TaxID=2185142 RepID=UPI000DF7C3E2|nr:YeeE/YedE thiosulfate transporter family protein [Altererythrobacter sp. ZODW24]